MPWVLRSHYADLPRSARRHKGSLPWQLDSSGEHDPQRDLCILEHRASNVEPGDVVVLPDGREALVTARVESEPGPLGALLGVLVAPGIPPSSSPRW